MEPYKINRELAPYATLGVEFAFSILMFVLLGRWLDKEFDTSNIFTISLLLFSVIGGFVRFLFKINQMSKKKNGNNSGNNSSTN